MVSRSVQAEADGFVTLVHDDAEAALAQLERSPTLAHSAAGWGETAMAAASHLGHRRLLDALIEAGAPSDIFAACAMADLRAVSAQLRMTGLDALGVHRLPLLHFAVVSRDPAMLDMLIDSGVALNPRGASLSPLHTAVAVGSVPMIRALMEAGVDRSMTDAFGATALDWAYEIEDKGSVLAVVLSGYLRRATEDLPTAG
ncbi:MAG TPA: ankyrin repeat domain-containing protein [Candidatus Dormibacteraeota bacterium]|jgi:ankyrin repeat protein